MIFGMEIINSLIKYACAAAIGFFPIPAVIRGILYSLLPSYSLGRRCQIGFGTVICVREFKAGKSVVIGRFNTFKGAGAVLLDEDVIIGRQNQFLCGNWARNRNEFQRLLNVGRNVRITDGHYFDFTGLIDIGRKTWIAGYGSQFWTHGAALAKSTVVVGENSYIGSAARFCPGASVGDDCRVGIGSVVTKSIQGNGQTIVGTPARPLPCD